MTPLKIRLDAYRQLMYLHQASTTISTMFPALITLWLATEGRPNLSLVIVVCLIALLSSSGSSAIAEWANAIRGEHPSGYPTIPALQKGDISLREPLLLGLVAYALATLAVIIVGGTVAIVVQLLALVFVALYLYLRHFLMLPHLFMSWYLGMIYSTGIPLSYALVKGELAWYVWAYVGINMFFVVACELQETIRFGLFSPEARSQPEAEAIPAPESFDTPIMVFSYGIFFIGVSLLCYFFELGPICWGAIAVSVIYALIWWLRARKLPPRGRRTAGFSGPQMIIIILFVGLVLDYVIRLDAYPAF